VTLTFDAAWAVGLLLATVRLAAFVVASPILSQLVPAAGRVAFVIGLGFFFAEPVAALDFASLVTAAFANAFTGLLLGFATGLIFHLFTVGGSLLDDFSGLRVGAIVDPITGAQAAVFSRAFNMTALVLFLVVGGHRLLIRGLGVTFEAVPLDGSLNLAAGLADAVVALVGRMLVAAVELAMPALAALFIAEVVLGIAARFSPQANVFLLGLPAKIITALASVWLVLLLMPETISGTMRIIEDTFSDVIAGLGP
jgi:flagellar biosynthetic protein FliR